MDIYNNHLFIHFILNLCFLIACLDIAKSQRLCFFIVPTQFMIKYVVEFLDSLVHI